MSSLTVTNAVLQLDTSDGFNAALARLQANASVSNIVSNQGQLQITFSVTISPFSP